MSVRSAARRRDGVLRRRREEGNPHPEPITWERYALFLAEHPESADAEVRISDSTRALIRSSHEAFKKVVAGLRADAGLSP